MNVERYIPYLVIEIRDFFSLNFFLHTEVNLASNLILFVCVCMCVVVVVVVEHPRPMLVLSNYFHTPQTA